MIKHSQSEPLRTWRPPPTEEGQIMLSTKAVAYAGIKHTVWHILRPFHRASAWPMKVRSGPAQGAVLVLDVRQNGAYWLGTYDDWILSHIRIQDWLPQGGIAWDCGAYIGYYSAIFRRVVGDHGKVIAFE